MTALAAGAQQPSEETLRLARAVYAGRLQAAFQRSPVARIADWIAAGQAPTAESLRAAGLTTRSTDPERVRELRLARKVFVRTWGFSIPCAEAIGVLSRLGPLVEIGAGSGYWTALLRHAGLDAIATDAAATGNIGYGFEAGRFCPVEPLSGHAAVRAHPERDVFCAWPTEGSPWALAAVRAMPVGRRLALIGEPRGGITGTPGLHHFLETRFQLLGALAIPQFPRCADQLSVYQRTR
ncbi:MAG: hypothetical protein JWP49_1680 [Phenylobacterium sp.]|nr:hypothetical protein [Phenylobacterium sp.]